VKDRRTVLGIGRHIRTFDRVRLAAIRHSEFMLFVRTAIDDQNSFVAVLLPCENLRGRVEQINTAKVVVGYVELGIATVQRELAAELWDGKVSLAGGQSDSVVGILKGVESSVPDHEELSDVAVESCDGEVGVASVAAVDVCAVLVLCCQVGR
jgi:hypothetical protein